MSARDNKAAREERLSGSMRVAQPCKVVRFDAQAMSVDVQPLVQAQIDGQYTAQPQLTGVPVVSLCMGGFVIRPWYAKGDIGLLIICDADIDGALEGKVAQPASSRGHDLSDAIFLGGLSGGGNAPDGLPSNALVLAAGSTYLAIASGGITISGSLTVNGVDIGAHTHDAPVGGGTTSGPQ